MSEKSPDGLLEFIRDSMGDYNIFYRRFKMGIETRSEAMINDAMMSIRLYDDEVRQPVEDAIMKWIFEKTDDNTELRAT